MLHLVAKLCLTLWDPMVCGSPGSSVRGLLQGGILEWVALLSSRGSSQTRDRTQFYCIAGRFKLKKKNGKKVIFQKFTERLSPSARKSLLENGIYNQIDPPLLDGNII